MFQPVTPALTLSGSLPQTSIWPWNPAPNLPLSPVTGIEFPKQTLLTSLNPRTGRLDMTQQLGLFPQPIKMDQFQLQHPYVLLQPMNSVQNIQTKLTNPTKQLILPEPSFPLTTADLFEPKTPSDSTLTVVNATALTPSNPVHPSLTNPFQPDTVLINSLQTQTQLGQVQPINPNDKGHTRLASDPRPTMNTPNPSKPQAPLDSVMPSPTESQFQPANPPYQGFTTVKEGKLQSQTTNGQRGTVQPKTTLDANVQWTPFDPVYAQTKSDSLPPISQDHISSDPLLSHNAIDLSHPPSPSLKGKPIMQENKIPLPHYKESMTTVDSLIHQITLNQIEPLHPQLHSDPLLHLTKAAPSQIQEASGRPQPSSSKEGQSQIISDSRQMLTTNQLQPQNPFDSLSGMSIADPSLPQSPSDSIMSIPPLNQLQRLDPSDPWLTITYEAQNPAKRKQQLNYLDPTLPVTNLEPLKPIITSDPGPLATMAGSHQPSNTSDTSSSMNSINQALTQIASEPGPNMTTSNTQDPLSPVPDLTITYPSQVQNPSAPTNSNNPQIPGDWLTALNRRTPQYWINQIPTTHSNAPQGIQSGPV
ncbi:sporozoite surface protein 2-like [Haliotis rufescens]|uniref:sporozoite surface protein 2-like n=1 Tax=Haliotis rufescens TaxID=6454 RepID=UPI00201F2E5B|nr:sporozoite surface protein 2-like [Haliotis rufescens]